jgi:hypothetical protein
MERRSLGTRASTFKYTRQSDRQSEVKVSAFPSPSCTELLLSETGDIRLMHLVKEGIIKVGDVLAYKQKLVGSNSVVEKDVVVRLR